MLSVESVRASYGKMEILHGVSFQAHRNTITALIGPNGAGKTTTLRTIMGLLKVTSGNIEFKDQDIAGLAPYEIIKKGISLIPEDRKLFPHMTVQENLMLGSFNARAWNSRQRSLDRVYDLFPRLEERRRQTAKTLSGGEQRMLGLGRGLMSEPELLILDEPSLGLAPKIVSEIFKVLEDIRKEGTTILLVEQNVARTLKISDKAYVLENGTIVMEGGGELIGAPHIREAYLRI
jgi:branched-chain amino acid transport system ATP-binding protein